MNPLRSIHLARAILRANLDRSRKPFKLTFVVTNRCNAHCLACNIWQKSEPPEPLSLSEVDTLFTKYPHFAWIDLTGGEPFLRPDLLELVAIVLRRVPRLYHLHLPTNAVAPELSIQRIRQILALNPPRLTITVSLDGPPEQHDTLRGVPGNWRHALEVLRHFDRHPDPRLQLFAGFTLSDRNVGTLTATMQAAQTQLPHLGPEQWHLNLAHHSAHYYDNLEQPLPSTNNQTAWLQELTTFGAHKQQRRFDPVAWLETRYLRTALTYVGGQRHPMPCRALETSLFLTPDGVVYPCSIWDHPVGKLREHALDLNQLLDSGPSRATTHAIHHKQCPGCWTPCDAYPTILGNLLPLARNRMPS
ncbi:MAG: radical SAM protein [Magnetococcales bacterium]|nr:radical SAM protein [Magnetococcales bacterium]